MASNFKNKDGLTIYTHESLLPNPQSGRANVMIIHGLHEHCHYYDELTAEFNKIGCNVFKLDHMGHGRSEGKRGSIPSINLCVRDVMEFTNSIKQRLPNMKFIVFGHSMGGIIALQMCVDHLNAYDAIILEGPAFEENPSIFLTAPLKLVARYFPNAPVKSFNLDDLTNDEEAVEEIRNDPLYLRQAVRAETGNAIMEAEKSVKSRLNLLKYPIYFTHGAGDKICLPEGSAYLHEFCPSIDKTLLIVPRALHQVHNELDDVKRKYFDDVMAWVIIRFSIG